MRRPKKHKDVTWSCFRCGETIKHGKAYVWWWRKGVVAHEECAKELSDMGTDYDRGVRQKPRKPILSSEKRSLKPPEGQTTLF